MTKSEAMQYAAEHYPCDFESDYCTVVRLRKKAVELPEYGADDSVRDDSEWAYFDMAGKLTRVCTERFITFKSERE